MRTRIAIFSALVALVAAGCGDGFGPDDTDAGQIKDAGSDAGIPLFAFTTGDYVVSNATATTDTCGVLSIYTAADKTIGISLSSDNTTVTFDLTNDKMNPAPANTLPKATLSDNDIVQPVEASYTSSVTNPTCTLRIHKSVTGQLVADDTVDLTLSFSAATETPNGGTCTPSNTGLDAVPCSATLKFTGKLAP